MNNLSMRVSGLTEERRELLELLLSENGGQVSPLLVIPQRHKTDSAPLSFAQQRLWFLDQLQPLNPAYNIASAYRLKGLLHIVTLERAITEIIRRHEALRTTYALVDGHQVQIINPAKPLSISIIDLSCFPVINREAKARDLAAEEAHRPFDLTKDLMMRCVLVKLDERDFAVLITMHHIASDGWSIGLFIGEMLTLYSAYSRGQSSPLPELNIQYADFAHWQLQYLQGAVLEEQLSYWKQQLSDLPTLELPTDKPRPAVQTYRGAVESWTVSKSTSEGLKLLGQQFQATLFMTLLAAFQVLLARYSRQEQIVVGSPVANRNRGEIEGLIGFFVNMLVLRANLEENPSFLALLDQVKEVALGAYARQDLPFEKLVEELQPRRDPSRHPLFQVMFALQSASSSRPGNAKESALPALEFERVTAKFDLELNMWDRPEGLAGKMVYNTDLFEAATIRRMLESFETMLEGVLADPTQPVSALPLLRPVESRQILCDWNQTRRHYPDHLCLHQLFEAQVDCSPQATAVVFEGTKLTYCELNQRANQLAHYLRGRGVGPEDLVGLCFERSLELVIALFGVLKAGAAFLPLDPNYPAERLAWMLADAEVSVLLMQERLRESLPPHAAQELYLDTGSAELATYPQTNLPSVTSPDNLAYVIYTSGSTGKPKGAMNTHRGICNRLRWMQEAYRLIQDDRVLQKTPYSFDVSVWEFFWPLLNGAGLVVARPGGHQDPAYLLEVIASQQITTLHFVPSMLQTLVIDRGLERCRSLKRVISSGEALGAKLQEQYFARTGAELHNLYGPTEAAIDVTAWNCRRGDGKVPIGKPIANTQIYILDEELKPVPIGVGGELHIGGVGVGRGYLRRAEMTAEKFIPDPFSEQRGARLYKTGDSARYLEDGNIEYLGRLDQQVKIRGYRIELGEIEAALNEHVGVKNAVSVVREIAAGGPQLVAYVTTEEPRPREDELRKYLKRRLPEYMVPRAIIALEELPLMANGKVDRRALPAPNISGEQNVEYVAPRTPMEESLAGIFAEVLGLERVGIYDHFFDLGGHSLLATLVISRLRELFHVELPLVMIFESPTVTSLSLSIAQILVKQFEQEKGMEVSDFVEAMERSVINHTE
jgi:amino acid adenylation domain-containing protein